MRKLVMISTFLVAVIGLSAGGRQAKAIPPTQYCEFMPTTTWAVLNPDGSVYVQAEVMTYGKAGQDYILSVSVNAKGGPHPLAWHDGNGKVISYAYHFPTPYGGQTQYAEMYETFPVGHPVAQAGATGWVEVKTTLQWFNWNKQPIADYEAVWSDGWHRLATK